MNFGTLLASENSRHFSTLPLVSPPNDVCSQWETSAEIPYYFWLVESNFPRGTTNQKHYPDLGNDASSSISALVSHTSFVGETSGSVAKSGLFSQAKTLPKDVVDLPRNLLDFKEHVVHLILRKYVGGRIHSTTRASVQWTSQVISFLIVLPSILKWLLTVSWSTAKGYHD